MSALSLRRIAGAALALTILAQPALAEIDVTRVETEQGHVAWLVEEPAIPFVALELRFRGGTSVDPDGARGAVNLMTGLLEEGAGDRDATAFAEARDDLAAGISFSASDDSVSVSARFLSDTTDEALALIRAALTEPAFAPDAVERVRGQVLSGLRQDAEDPDAIASDAFTSAVYGDHPYATSGEGSLESVRALTREDLIAAHDAAIARDRVYVAAVGDITAEELAPKLDRLLSGLPQGGAPLPGPADLSFDGGVTVVDYDTPQSVLQFGHAGMDRDDPDFFAAYVVSHILGGGGFESRLMREVRAERGLTYGIYSYLAQKDHAALYVGRAATANATAAEAVDLIREEWREMAAEGPSAAELAAAKTYLTGAYPLRFDGNANIANILVGMQMDGLSRDYFATRNGKVEAVTLDDARRAARRLIAPEALSFVVVGRPEGLPPGN